MTDYLDMAAEVLAKLINDEYAVILANERTNYPRALSIGEKLVALRRGVEHGEWQRKLEACCPRISYETATKYIRLWNKREDVEAEATIKGVATTDLTIDAALKLIAKPKAEKPEKGKPAKAVKAGVEPAIEPGPSREEDVAREWMRPLEFDELAIVLREMFDADYLSKLARVLTTTQQATSTFAGIERRA